MNRKFRHNISANVVQLTVNHLFNLLTFYFLSLELSKKDFGALNWSLAVFLSVFSLASFGFDQIIIKKAASGEPPEELLSLHLFHVLVSGIFFYGFLLTLFAFIGDAIPYPQLFLYLGLGKLLLFFSTPFKSIAAGREQFRVLLWMSVSSSLLKAAFIISFAWTGAVSLSTVIPVFVLADASELALGFFLARKRLHLNIARSCPFQDYLQFLKASLPQAGTVLFTSALSRIDWILLGLFLSATRLAEYSFAYKAFEFATLPLLAIAPLLVPQFARMWKSGISLQQDPNIQRLLRIEMVIACFAALCLNLLWNPVVDFITEGKYGNTNAHTIFIFSLSLPVLYFNNFLWSLHFASGNLRLIFNSFVLAFAINLAGNLLLIPVFGNEGAATAFFLATTGQTIFYACFLETKINSSTSSLMACSCCALLSGLIAHLLTTDPFLLFVTGCALYAVFLCCISQFRKKDGGYLWQTDTA